MPAPPPRRRNALVVAAGAAALAVMLSGGWWLLARTPLPSPPPAAASWYARGIDAVRQGAYVSGRRALEEAVRLFPEYTLAYSRLAEVLSALDEERNAQAALIRVSVLVPDQARLPAEDRLRLDAIRSMVLREFDHAIAAYTELTRLRPSDAGALVDFGRAHEAAGQLTAARDSYERATKLDDQFAAGFLRLDPCSESLASSRMPCVRSMKLSVCMRSLPARKAASKHCCSARRNWTPRVASPKRHMPRTKPADSLRKAECSRSSSARIFSVAALKSARALSPKAKPRSAPRSLGRLRRGFKASPPTG